MRKTFSAIFLLLASLFATSVRGEEHTMPAQSLPADIATIVSAPFGANKDGEPVELFTLTNRKGCVAKIMDYGATLTEWWVPDKEGKLVDIVLGFATLQQYEEDTAYLGAIIGRYTNRISGGRFSLDGRDFTLALNHGRNTLHGGTVGFNKRLWRAEPLGRDSVRFSYLSKDMEEGFPGNLSTSVIYTLTDENELRIEYEAATDKPTPINLTNHAYFNLAGAGNGNILNHIVQIDAYSYTPTDDEGIPTGEIASVLHTPFDFRQATEIGKRLDAAGRYDLNYVLLPHHGKLAKAAVVQCPASGLQLQVDTTEPGLQFYAGNNLKGNARGIGGVYRKYSAFCMEAQHYPDSVNRPSFPNTILTPGEPYKQTTVYKISKIQS